MQGARRLVSGSDNDPALSSRCIRQLLRQNSSHVVLTPPPDVSEQRRQFERLERFLHVFLWLAQRQRTIWHVREHVVAPVARRPASAVNGQCQVSPR